MRKACEGIALTSTDIVAPKLSQLATGPPARLPAASGYTRVPPLGVHPEGRPARRRHDRERGRQPRPAGPALCPSLHHERKPIAESVHPGRRPSDERRKRLRKLACGVNGVGIALQIVPELPNDLSLTPAIMSPTVSPEWPALLLRILNRAAGIAKRAPTWRLSGNERHVLGRAAEEAVVGRHARGWRAGRRGRRGGRQVFEHAQAW